MHGSAALLEGTGSSAIAIRLSTFSLFRSRRFHLVNGVNRVL